MNYFHFENFPVLKTSRLELRAVTSRHLEQFRPIAYMDGKPIQVEEEILNCISRIQKIYREREGINWGLFHNGNLIGTCGFYRGFKDNIGEIGYVLNDDYHRRGFMSEAIIEILDFGFNELELVEIVAYTPINNVPSVELLLNLGFKNTGRIKDHFTIFSIERQAIS